MSTLKIIIMLINKFSTSDIVVPTFLVGSLDLGFSLIYRVTYYGNSDCVKSCQAGPSCSKGG